MHVRRHFTLPVLAVLLPAALGMMLSPSADAADAPFGAHALSSPFQLTQQITTVATAPAASHAVTTDLIAGTTAADFGTGFLPESQAAADTVLGGVGFDGTVAKIVGPTAMQQAPPAGNKPITDNGTAFVFQQAAGNATAISGSTGGYTVNALPAEPANDPVSTASVDSIALTTFPDGLPTGSGSATAPSAAGADDLASVTVTGARSRATTRIDQAGGVAAPTSTAEVALDQFTFAGYTFVVAPVTLTAVATGSASTSSVTLSKPVITYGGNGVASGTPLPSDGLKGFGPDSGFTVTPGDLVQTNTGTSVTGSFTALRFSLTVLGTTREPAVTSTAIVGDLTVRAAAPAPTPNGGGGTSPPGAPASSPPPQQQAAVLANTGSTTTIELTSALCLLGGGLLLTVAARRRRPGAGA